MKRILCLVIALLMVTFAFTACKKEDTPPAYEEIDRSPVETLDGVTVTSEQTDYVLIEVADYGSILVRLYPNVAPETVANFKKLVSEGFYDGLIFHRVIEDFMIQGGDPEGTGMGGSGTNIKGEFSKNGFENNLKHTRGVLSMARSNDPDSASSQFFICHKTAGVGHLDGNYASFGYVVNGMDVVDEIAEVKTNSGDKPIKDVVITSIKFASVPEAK
ncbi:MAG: peptidylprolyl isomerase [Ruminococcaceae bacterium]|nr:peptidylprolyl isomerase [Oscillospiraceae bacterium]